MMTDDIITQMSDRIAYERQREVKEGESIAKKKKKHDRCEQAIA